MDCLRILHEGRKEPNQEVLKMGIVKLLKVLVNECEGMHELIGSTCRDCERPMEPFALQFVHALTAIGILASLIKSG